MVFYLLHDIQRKTSSSNTAFRFMMKNQQILLFYLPKNILGLYSSKNNTETFISIKF